MAYGIGKLGIILLLFKSISSSSILCLLPSPAYLVYCFSIDVYLSLNPLAHPWPHTYWLFLPFSQANQLIVCNTVPCLKQLGTSQGLVTAGRRNPSQAAAALRSRLARRFKALCAARHTQRSERCWRPRLPHGPMH